MIFSEIARTALPFPLVTLINKPNQLFHDFPYVLLRTGVALFGILLPLLLYALLRTITVAPRMSGAIALLVVIDPALIIYSRFILPDMLLLVFEFLALLFAFAAVHTTSRQKALTYVLFGATALGFACGIKWTALAVFATIALLYLLSKRYAAIFISFVVVAFFYLVIFVSSMFYFPNGGKLDPMVAAYDTPYITNISFPTPPTVSHTIPFLIDYHHAILAANKDPEISAHILQGSNPLSWSTSKITYAFWKGTDGNRIVLQGNVILWPILFFCFLFEATWIAAKFFHSRIWPIGRDETVLLAGYVMNYLPFFVIDRPMHLYHYLTALIFLFLLIPKILPRVLAVHHCRFESSHSSRGLWLAYSSLKSFVIFSTRFPLFTDCKKTRYLITEISIVSNDYFPYDRAKW